MRGLATFVACPATSEFGAILCDEEPRKGSYLNALPCAVQAATLGAAREHYTLSTCSDDACFQEPYGARPGFRTQESRVLSACARVRARARARPPSTAMLHIVRSLWMLACQEFIRLGLEQKHKKCAWRHSAV